MHASFDPRVFDYAEQFRQVGFASTLVCFDLSASGIIRRASAGACVALGYEASELCGRHVFELFPLNEIDTVKAALSSSCMDGEQRRCTLLGKHGLPLFVNVSCLPSPDQGEAGLYLLSAPAHETPVEQLALPRAPAAALGVYYDDQDYSHDRNFHFGLYESANDGIATAAQRLIAEFCAGVGTLSDKSVLDIGCGTGDVDVQLATRYGCRSVHGITISGVQLRMCEQAAHDAGVADRVRFSLVDANDMNVGTGAYEVAVAIESIFHMDRRQIFTRVRDGLTPGGTFAFCDIYPLDGGIVHSRTGEHTFISLGQTVRLLREHGFRNIRMIDWTDRALPNYAQLFGFCAGLASHAIKTQLSVEQTFQAAEYFIKRPLSAAMRTELVAEVFAQQRGSSKVNPRLGYAFFAAERGS